MKFDSMPMPSKKSDKQPAEQEYDLFGKDDESPDEMDGEGEEKDEDQNEELKEVSDEDLIAECKKRGINVDEGKPSKAGPVAGE